MNNNVLRVAFSIKKWYKSLDIVVEVLCTMDQRVPCDLVLLKIGQRTIALCQTSDGKCWFELSVSHLPKLSYNTETVDEIAELTRNYINTVIVPELELSLSKYYDW